MDGNPRSLQRDETEQRQSLAGGEQRAAEGRSCPPCRQPEPRHWAELHLLAPHLTDSTRFLPGTEDLKDHQRQHRPTHRVG